MKGKLHVYTGNGKGKTTAAMGLALRSLGHGRRVLIAQFLKDGRSGELAALDELNVALSCGMVTQENAEKLIDAALAFGDVVSTGRNAPEWLRARADYVSEIAAQKHPFETEKLAAREGIEY